MKKLIKYKAIKYFMKKIKKLKLYQLYDQCISRRYMLLIRLLKLDSPSIIISQQVKLIKQSFLMWLFHRYLEYYKFKILNSIQNVNLNLKKIIL